MPSITDLLFGGGANMGGAGYQPSMDSAISQMIAAMGQGGAQTGLPANPFARGMSGSGVQPGMGLGGALGNMDPMWLMHMLSNGGNMSLMSMLSAMRGAGGAAGGAPTAPMSSIQASGMGSGNTGLSQLAARLMSR